MSTHCDDVQKRLAELGLDAIGEGEEATRTHLAECEACHGVLLALQEVDTQLALLPSVTPPTGLVASTLARVRELSLLEGPPPSSASVEAVKSEESREREATPRSGFWGALMASLRRRPVVAVGLAGGCLVILGGILAQQLALGPSAEPPQAVDGKLPEPTNGVQHAYDPSQSSSLREISEAGNLRSSTTGLAPRSPSEDQTLGPLGARDQIAMGDVLGGVAGTPDGRSSVEVFSLPVETTTDRPESLTLVPELPPIVLEGRVSGRDDGDWGWRGETLSLGGEAQWIDEWGRVAALDVDTNGEVLPNSGEVSALDMGGSVLLPPSSTPGDEESRGRNEEGGISTRAPTFQTSTFLTPSPDDLARALGFLAERDLVDDLQFVEPRGYWANTYVPGDPVLRALQRRMSTRTSPVAHVSGMSLAALSEMVSQPFDPPTRSALSVYLQADQRGVQGPSRVLLQVGLQGSERQSGRRPPMNVGVVLDLRASLSTSNAASVRALLESLSQAHDLGDRFALVVAGSPGGVVLPPGSFAFGPVSVAARQLLGRGEPLSVGDPGVTLSLVEAMAAATELVGAGDDPTAPLGSSLVLLVTPSSLGEAGPALRELAHRGAVGGIPTSVVAVGREVSLQEIDAVALAGQGNRRLLGSAAEAEALVDRELSASSRAVARAVRLRIRLAPGVQLVDVLGSQRLDERAAVRVRVAEQSIDLRVSRTLGIEADRGEDEDGIQIVIPAFYAGDAHVILLDVVVPGPGPVADVSARFKDLVHLRNGVVRDTLSLEREQTTRGPLEINVLKNLLAHELSLALRRAGTLVAEGRVGDAEQVIAEALSLLRGMQEEIPDLATDPGLYRDIALVSGYLSVLAASPGDAMPPNDLADSLLYAGYRKLLPPPDEMQ